MPVAKTSARLAAYRSVMKEARGAYGAGALDHCFSLLERAHILGQPWIVPHTVSHWMMLKVGLRRGDLREIWGQVIRLAFGGLLSAVGILPEGNTGGADVPAKKPLPLPADLVSICRGG
ncbi:MAG: DUF3703 domain-containing protein [Caulobacter sp.]|nr:DUF3703 domain-containing protein [Caulobacter sp.]